MSKWYEFLTAVYGGKDDSVKRIAYQTLFADEDPDILLEAVKQLSQEQTFMPRPNEITAVVCKIKAEREEAQDTKWLQWARREKFKSAYLTWRECPDGCGERIPPGHTTCPFCEDMAEMALEVA